MEDYKKDEETALRQIDDLLQDLALNQKLDPVAIAMAMSYLYGRYRGVMCARADIEGCTTPHSICSEAADVYNEGFEDSVEEMDNKARIEKMN